MDIVEKLRSQIGDDVQHVFDREALFRIAADEIERLRAENDRLQQSPNSGEAFADYRGHISALQNNQ